MMERNNQYEDYTYKEEATFRKFTNNSVPVLLSLRIFEKGEREGFVFFISISAQITTRIYFCLKICNKKN